MVTYGTRPRQSYTVQQIIIIIVIMLFCASLCMFEDLLWDDLKPSLAVCVPRTSGHTVATSMGVHLNFSASAPLPPLVHTVCESAWRHPASVQDDGAMYM